ncbi:MAG: iron ABC transporter permease [Acidimicrobiia bacterium]|nr:iron ABC transporter permease [Acidimicrobiia bacterium]
MARAATDAPPPSTAPGSGRREAGRRRAPVALVVAALVVAVAAVIPLAYLVIRTQELGVERIWEIATRPRTLEQLRNTVVLAVAVTATSVALAVPLAWLTVRTDLPGRRIFTVLCALPLAVPTYVGGFAFVVFAGPRGMAQSWLEPLGVDRLPSIYGFWGAWAVLTLFSYPYVLLTTRAALRRLDPSLEETSRTLGHGPLSTFRRVILPQLRPSIVAGSLLVALYTLSDFGAVSLLRYDSFTRAIFNMYRASIDRSAAAVLGLMLVAITIAVVAFELRSRGRQTYHRLHAGGGRTPATVPLGRWRWPAAAACAALVTVALVIPLGVITFWLVRGLSVGEPMRLTLELAVNSVRASALAAIVAVVAAWPVALLTARHPSRTSKVVEVACWSGYALPGVVVALSLVFVGIRLDAARPTIAGVEFPGVYQTLAMLVFAYVVLFLPQAIGSMRSSLLQINPTYEEASRLLGKDGPSTFRRVVMPLARPGVLAGGALVFLTAMKELPATLLLAPTGYRTLATQVYDATREGFYGRAAAPALALVLLSSLPMAYLVLRERSNT